MSSAIAYPNASDLSTDSYLPVGLALCFTKEEGEVKQVQVLEPIPSSTLATLLAGTTTSYQKVFGLTLGELLEGEQVKPRPEFPAEAMLAENFAFRAISAARTYQRNPEFATQIPPGTTYDRLNHSTERKRVLNADNIVGQDDNVKQHAYTHQVL